MKTLITKFLAFSGLAVVLLSSCKKDEVRTVANTGSATTTLTLSTPTPVLSKATLANTAITITGTPQNYGYTAAPTYSFQIAVKGTSFAAPVTVDLPTGTFTKTYNVQDFNNLLLSMKLPVNVSAQLEVRQKSALSSTAGITYSNVATITATPFPLTSWIYAVGAFQNWNASNPDSLISLLGDGVYKGIINFTAGNNEFLILPAKNYNNKYATTQTAAPTSTVAYNAGNNLKAPTVAGQYAVTFDSNLGTITFGLANLYSAIGSTVGDASGFSKDVALTKYVNDGATGWTGLVPFNVGTFKIRQNNDWTWSFGVPKSGSDGYGVANALNDNSNDNIPITVAGTYQVSFYIIPSVMGATPGASVPPTTTAIYKLVKQ